jgi:hypothetical protein
LGQNIDQLCKMSNEIIHWGGGKYSLKDCFHRGMEKFDSIIKPQMVSKRVFLPEIFTRMLNER